MMMDDDRNDNNNNDDDDGGSVLDDFSRPWVFNRNFSPTPSSSSLQSRGSAYTTPCRANI